MSISVKCSAPSYSTAKRMRDVARSETTKSRWATHRVGVAFVRDAAVVEVAVTETGASVVVDADGVGVGAGAGVEAVATTVVVAGGAALADGVDFVPFDC